MAKKIIRKVDFRRRRAGKTNYKNRLKHLVSKKPRAVIRRSVKNFIVQIVEYLPDGDKTHVLVNSGSLSKLGWNYSKSNMSSAYLTGLMAGKKAIEAGVKEAIIDLGMNTKIHGSKLYAAVKGLIDAGMDIPNSEDCFPSEERIKGEHVQAYAESLKDNKEAFDKQFSGYNKNKADPTKIVSEFETVKGKILK